MQDHPFDNDFTISSEQIRQFQRDGFVKLSGFFNSEVVRTLLNRVEVEMSRAPDNFKSEFSRLKYDFETEKTDIYDLIGRPYFRKALTALVERDLFLTFELCFELEKNVSKGFPWHVGVQSFGYQLADEFGSPFGRLSILSENQANEVAWPMCPSTLCLGSSSMTRLSRP